MKIKSKYNFLKTQSNINLYKYYDKENVVALYIFKSGWKDFYHCILEWGEYENTDILQLRANDIFNFYGIKTFSRKEKLKKINESLL